MLYTYFTIARIIDTAVNKMSLTCYLLLLLLLSFQSITSGSVYNVTPDDLNTTCHHCHNLQHYLHNTTKYFTSNTRLLFQPGIHHLHTNLIIRNIHNISLIGNSITDDTTPTAIIQCEYLAGASITFIEITNLTISKLVIQNCVSQFVLQHGGINSAAVFIKECSSVILYQLHIHKGDPCHPSYALMTVNIIGRLSHISCYGIIMYTIEPSTETTMVYNDTFYVSIDHYTPYNRDYCDGISLINLNVKQTSYGMTLQLANMVTRYLLSTSHLLYSEISGTVTLQIIQCKVINCYFQTAFDFHFMHLKSASEEAMVQFVKCQFINNIASNAALLRSTAEIQTPTDKVWFSILNCLFLNNMLNSALISLLNSNAELSKCNFFNNSNSQLLQSQFIGQEHGILLLRNSSFFYNSASNEMNLINTSNIFLLLMNKVTIYENMFRTIINLGSFSTISVSQAELNFSRNNAYNIIDFSCKDCIEFVTIAGAKLTFFENHVCSIFGIIKMAFPFCIFQYYYSIKASSSNQNNSYSVTFENNFYNSDHCYNHVPIKDCYWVEDSVFANSIPIDVNNKYIKYVNSSGTYNMAQQNYDHRTICLCHKVNSHLTPDCSKNQLGYLYPGQTLIMHIYVNKHFNRSRVKIDFESDVTQLYVPTCIIDDAYKKMEVFRRTCMGVSSTIIVFPDDTKCALYLKIFGDSNDNLNLFYLIPLPCPPGFIKANQKCVCYPKLAKFGVLGCNINDQTILRPANSWISTTSYNNSYKYQISLECPFHYCLSHLSHLNLSTPNSQCRFNRSGILCGQCQQGFSTIFASYECQYCHNSYLFLIIPIAIAGLVLVLLLFILNLTVTDGTINTFILYVNITGINASVLFDEFTLTNTLTSLANLDLGIQTCFYNGMDDYAKMWLQLAFPAYLIFIATLLIITSRYSTRIQRLTAHRALPVLATLFLLSYNKILNTVSSILFSYSIITQLPSEQSILVWSIDANVSVLGLKFIVLFTTCLLIFLLQVPFSIILLFNRPLRRFNYINKFKPFLDAYQGPYKDKHYYWTGIQLIIRVLFLGISTLDATTYFKVSNFIIASMSAMTGILHPFKSKYHNYQEQLILLNLQALHIFANQSSHMTIVHAVNTFAVVHFAIIVIYHIITYMCGGVIRYKIQQSLSSIKGCITNRSTVQRFELCNIPEVAFNYREYQEPLVGYQ